MSKDKIILVAVYYIHCKGHLSMEEFRSISEVFPQYMKCLRMVAATDNNGVLDRIRARSLSSEFALRALTIVDTV